MHAHNVKNITQDDKMRVKGPVRTGDEKFAMEANANVIARDANFASRMKAVSAKSRRINLK
jgi:hypothetical protein